MATVFYYFEHGKAKADTVCNRCEPRTEAGLYLGCKAETVNLAPDEACSYCGAEREPVGTPNVFPIYNRTGTPTGRFQIVDTLGPTGAEFQNRKDAETWTR